jgi:hypothetical protein
MKSERYLILKRDCAKIPLVKFKSQITEHRPVHISIEKLVHCKQFSIMYSQNRFSQASLSISIIEI